MSTYLSQTTVDWGMLEMAHDSKYSMMGASEPRLTHSTHASRLHVFANMILTSCDIGDGDGT